MPTALHLGIGNFHRAHQAPCIQKLPGWEIIGVSLRSPGIRDALRQQGYDYTLVTRDSTDAQFEKITAIRDVLFAPEATNLVLDAISTADLITLTVTEKGYCLKPDGELDLNHPLISSDVEGKNATAIALLTRGLAQRTDPVVVLSCDNLPENGKKLGRAVERFADAANIKLDPNLFFPNTMVDRITPATTATLRELVERETGFADLCPVATEPFSEWIIEKCDGPLPDLDQVGATLVNGVAPFEARKLRLLNGAHSALAYAGIQAGYQFVHEAISDTRIRALVDGIMVEASATLPPEIDTRDYREALIDRFENSSINHELRQIAMDGSQKLPVRLFSSIQGRTELGLACPHLWSGVEAWASFVIDEVERGNQLNDPRADDLVTAARTRDPEGALLSLLDAPRRFG